MQLPIRLDAINLRDLRIIGSLEQIQPLPRARSDVEAHALGVILQQRHYDRSGHFARQRAEEGPEFGEPGIFEVVDAEEGCDFEVDEQRCDGDGEVVGGVAHEQ